MQRSALCRSGRELSNEYLLDEIGVDTAENETLQVWAENSIQCSIASLFLTPMRANRREFPEASNRFQRTRQLLRRGNAPNLNHEKDFTGRQLFRF